MSDKSGLVVFLMLPCVLGAWGLSFFIGNSVWIVAWMLGWVWSGFCATTIVSVRQDTGLYRVLNKRLW